MHKIVRSGVAAAAVASMLATSGFAFAHGRDGHDRGRQRQNNGWRQFSDIGQVPWAQPGIAAMQAQGVLQGTAPGTFDPGGLLTRAEMAAILGRLFNWQPAGPPAPGGPLSPGVGFFNDESAIPGYALPYVGIASRKGILRGMPGGRFMPDGHITWAQLAVIIARAYNYPQVAPGNVAALVQQLPNGAHTPAWATEAVAQDVQAGDFSGLLADLFQPRQRVTRAELAQFLLQVEGQTSTGAVTNGNVLTGQITAVNGLQWTVQTQSGTQTVTVSPTASVYAESTASTTAAVQTGDTVTLVEAGGEVVAVNITAGPTTTPITQGTALTGNITSVLVASDEIVLALPGIPTLTLSVSPSVSVTVNGTASSLSALSGGQTVTVELNSSGQVTMIDAGGTTGIGTTPETGTVVSYSNDMLQISSAGMTYTYTVSPYATVSVNGSGASLSALATGETVELTLNGAEVEAIDVLSGTTTGSGLSVTSTSLPNAAIDSYYSQTLTASGGSGSYSWTYLSGSLPPGLTVNGNGTITGTPTADGTYTFVVEARDNNLGTTATAQYSLTVGASGSSNLAIATTSLPNAVLGSGYSQTLTATGGSGSYSWMFESGTFPPGLTVESNGTITGTPTTPGTYSFTLAVRDNTLAYTANASFTITVGSSTGLTVTTATLPNATLDAAYVQTLGASGGSGSYTWTLAAGSLPPGLTLNGAQITGTPTTAGTYTFTMEARDNANAALTGSAALSLTVVG